MKNLQRKNSITICIPTRNRNDYLKRNLDEMKQNPDFSDYQIIVSDNGSERPLSQDGYSEFGNLKFLRFSSDQGFTRNIIQLIENCDTSYLMFCSDEDTVLFQNLSKLNRFIQQGEPIFVSSPVLKSKGFIRRPPSFFRGQLDRWKCGVRELTAREIRSASNYLSGLVFNAEFAKSCMDFLEINKDNRMVALYPQVVLAALALMHAREREDNGFQRGGVLAFRTPLIEKRFQLPTSIVDIDSNSYRTVSSRVLQNKDFDKLLVQIFENSNLKNLKEMRKAERQSFFQILRGSIDYELGPNYLNSFDLYALRLGLAPLHLLRVIRKSFLSS